MDEVKPDFKMLFLGVALGILCFYIGNSYLSNGIPDALEIESSDGKSSGYVEIDQELMEIVKLEGDKVKSPGMFVAFPIYKELGN